MITIEKTEFSGFDAAIRGARNPMNSWDKGDTVPGYGDNGCDVIIGENDLDLLHRLRKAGTDHRKFMRMICVWCDITAPLYWWKEYDTYKVGTVANSCSTMHKIHAKKFTLDDFSCEHLMGFDNTPTKGLVRVSCDVLTPVDVLSVVIECLNNFRELYLESRNKIFWEQMIQLLPTSYNQKRTVLLNYEVLANIYHSRKNHKLGEWHDLCRWIESLPYSELITGKGSEKNE